MDKEKFETSKGTLRKLLAIQQQHTQQSDYRKNESDQVVYERLDGLIADAAADLLAVYADECEEKPMKSEMPCNCKPKTLQEIIEEAKAELTDNKTFAAVVFRLDN